MRLMQSLCAVCGSNLVGLTVLYIVLPCGADVSIVNCAVCQQFNKRTLLFFLPSAHMIPRGFKKITGKKYENRYEKSIGAVISR